MDDKHLNALESLSRRRWHERWFGREMRLGEIVDITPLIDFAVSLFVRFVEDRFFRVNTERMKQIEDLFRDFIRKEVDKTHTFSGEQLGNIETRILRKVLPELERDRLSSGIQVFSNYDEVKTALGTMMRWRIISCLSRKPMVAKELSKAIPQAREEAVRRAVEQMVKIGIVEIRSRVVEGKALKEYALNAPILIVDLRE